MLWRHPVQTGRKYDTPSGECTSTRDRPAGGNTGRVFLTFGGPVCADRNSIYPLDRVLTYKSLIYLLNLQFSALGSPKAKIQTGTQSQSYREACILKSCCDSCAFCSYRRHVFQGSVASRKCLFPAKACRCFFSKTVRFCDQCKRCSNCFNLSSCRGQAAGVLADLGLYGSQSSGGVHFKERLHPPLSDKASSRLGTFDSEPLRDFCQAEPFTGVGLVALSKTSHWTGTQPILPDFYNTLFLVPKPNNRWRPFWISVL